LPKKQVKVCKQVDIFAELMTFLSGQQLVYFYQQLECMHDNKHSKI